MLSDTTDTDGTVHKWHGNPVEMEARGCSSAPTISSGTRVPASSTPPARFISAISIATSRSGPAAWSTTPRKRRESSTTSAAKPTRASSRVPACSPPAAHSTLRASGPSASAKSTSSITDGSLTVKCRTRGGRCAVPNSISSPASAPSLTVPCFCCGRCPLFYTPFFYHSLEREPRRSGFLTPNIGHSSQRGFLLGRYFLAIKRSYNLTYLFQDYTARGYAHHVDFSGKPREGTDFDAILYGVQDRGVPNSGNPPQKYSGFSLYAMGKSDLGDGWTARAAINYITSFGFRQEWTQSYNEAVGSEIHSGGLPQQKLVELHVQCGVRASILLDRP